MNTNVTSVEQNSYDNVIVALSTTTVNITTTTCSCTPISHNVSRTVCIADGFVYVETPQYRVPSCGDSTFLSYRITQLPIGGELQVDGVAVTLNQDLTKEQMAKLVYKLKYANTVTDTARFTVRLSCGTSAGNNIVFTVAECENDGCQDCSSTTTFPNTTFVTTTTTP